jgi:hypothetical protein
LVAKGSIHSTLSTICSVFSDKNGIFVPFGLSCERK